MRKTHQHLTYASLIVAVGCLLTAAGCGQGRVGPDDGVDAPLTPLQVVDGSQYQLTSEPESAQDVIQVREDAGDGDDVVVVGRIGGSANPWIDGRAAFSIVDQSLKACSDIPGDTCTQPWDYCCETDRLPTATALVKIVDSQGGLVEADAKGLLNVAELSTVVVQGKAQRDDVGNLTILASGVHVRAAASSDSVR